MSPKLHPRTLHVQSAKTELSRAVLDIATECDLTPAEVVSILVQVLAEWPKFLLRAERHPHDPDKKADEA